MTKEVPTVTKENLFEVMIGAHYRNLQASLPFFNDGQMHDRDGNALVEGDENPHYQGLYLIYDGAKILKRATSRLARSKAVRELHPVSDLESFVEEVAPQGVESKRKNTDVVLAYNTVK